MFGHDVDHEPTHKLKAGLSNFFVFVPEVWPKQRSEKLQKKRPKLVLKNKNQNRLAFSFFAHAVQIWGYNFRSKTVKLSGASQKCHFAIFLVKSLDGWRIGQWNLCRCSWVFSIVPTKFHLDRERFLYEFNVQKLVLLSFRGYLGEIESEKKKLTIFHAVFFFVNVQCCVRVSASNFQVLTPKSGGARAFGNIVRFLAGPTRICFCFRWVSIRVSAANCAWLRKAPIIVI